MSSRARLPPGAVAGEQEALAQHELDLALVGAAVVIAEREEGQVEHGRFDPLFMNLWDFRRTLGVGSLFFKF